MKLEFVEMAGFRGVREKVRYEFGAGFTVVTGRNGVGKSTVFDAIDFALTGSINKYAVSSAKGGGLADHIWWVGDEPANEHLVTVGFISDQGEKIEVTKSRGHSDEQNIGLLLQSLCGPRAGSASMSDLGSILN